MNQIDLNPFTKTPVSIGGKVYGMLSTVFTKWFDQIAQALYRPSWSGNVSFNAIPSGQTSDFLVQFEAGTVNPFTDFPVLQSPGPLNGTCFTVSIGAPDQVFIHFCNFSGVNKGFPIPSHFGITILKG